MKRIFVGCVIVGIGIATPARGENRVQVVNEGSVPLIVVPGDLKAIPETLWAAGELADTLGKITGREPEVLSEGQGVYRKEAGARRLVPLSRLNAPPAGTPEIHIGWTSRALQNIDQARVEKLDVDGFLIRTSPEAIFLTGPKDWSTAYACFTFLEDDCGVRWYLPGEFGEDIPRQPALSVPTGEKTCEPAFQHREYTGFQWRHGAELRQWQMHAKIRPRIRYHHNLYQVFNVAKHEKDYPELWPIIGGQRRIPGPNSPTGWQPCLTHPKAVDLAVEYARDVFSRNPQETSISLGINDGGGYCECPNCMKLVDQTAPETQRRSRWFFQFANAVAQRFDELFPDKVIGCLLYGQCRQFAPDLKIHPRLIGFYVSPSYGLITPEGKKAYDEGLAEIAKAAPRFGLYDWFYGDGLCIPRLQIRQAKYWLQHGYEMGARHIKAEAYMNWGLDGFKYWLHAKLMWNPSLEVDPLMDEFFQRFFKEAGPAMKEYFRVVERYTVEPVSVLWDAGEGPEAQTANFMFGYAEQLASFPPKAVTECEPFLNEAEKRASSFLVRERVRYFRSAFEVSRMMTLRYHAAVEALPLVEKGDTLPDGLARFAQGLHRDLDVDQWYRWVLKDDPFCVRYPPATAFGATTRARAAAAATLGRDIIDELRPTRPGSLTVASIEEARTRVLQRALAKIPSAETLEAVRNSIEPFAGKVILCLRAEAAPQIDGQLDDACWKLAPVYSDFAQHGSGKSPSYRTEIRLVHDSDRLYVAFQCYQDTGALLAWTRERDGRVWREDGVEFLLNRPTDTTERQRLQIIVSTRGNLFDYYDGSETWNGDIAVQTRIEPTFYAIELGIPVKAIGIDPAQNRFLRVNFVRNVYARKDLSGGEPKEISNWYLTPFSNLDPKARGWVIFN